jgi:ABC-2 type transport system ATP-binding protein
MSTSTTVLSDSATEQAVPIRAHNTVAKQLGHWTDRRQFDVRASRSTVVLDLRSPQIPAGEIEISLDADHAIVKLLVNDGAVIDHGDVRRIGRGRIKDWTGSTAACGRRIVLTGELRDAEVRASRWHRHPVGHVQPRIPCRRPTGTPRRSVPYHRRPEPMSAAMATAGAPLLEARRLTVRFGKVTALDALDLTAPPGQVLAILGPNGAGKTTFVRTVATLVRPTSGELLVRGRDVVREAARVRRDIGLAGQFAAVEPTMSGRENLEMTARLFGHGRARARRAAAAVIDQLSLEEVADRRAGTYSGGQRRRLDLGASLVGGPRLLLLDEPTTGLDPVSRREVWDAVRSLAAAGTDILLTTHYLDEADELADQAVVIDHGRAIASGTVSELKASIGQDVIEVAVADQVMVAAAGQILERVTATQPRLDAGGRRLSALAPGGPAALAAVIACLGDAAIGVDEIGLRRPTLDEVFLTLTGDEVATPAAAGHPNGSMR